MAGPRHAPPRAPGPGGRPGGRTRPWDGSYAWSAGNDRHRPRRGGAAADQPQREARHLEPLEGELVEVDQPFDLGVREVALVGGPEHARLAALLGALRLHVQRLG